MNKNSPRSSRGCNKQVFSDINFDIKFAIACKHVLLFVSWYIAILTVRS